MPLVAAPLLYNVVHDSVQARHCTAVLDIVRRREPLGDDETRRRTAGKVLKRDLDGVCDAEALLNLG